MFGMCLIVAGGLLSQDPGQTATTAPKKPPTARRAAPKAVGPTTPTPPKKVQPVTDEEKTIYALGLSIARSLKNFDLSPAELELVRAAISDSAAGKPSVDLDAWGPKIGPLQQARGARVAERERAAGQTFLASEAEKPGVKKTNSGLLYFELMPGSGGSPKASDTVKVNYRGTLIDGTEFDSSSKHNGPAEFALNSVIPCWTEGVQMMKVGGKARLVCPSQLAYGDRGNQAIPGGATLVFEIELVGIGGAGTP